MKFASILMLCAFTALLAAASTDAQSCRAYGYSGTCRTTSSCSSLNQGSVAGFCPGAASYQCCIQVPCTVPGVGRGVCKSTTVSGQCKGTTYSGYCPGPSTFRCCVSGGSSGGSNKYTFPIPTSVSGTCWYSHSEAGVGTHSGEWQSANGQDLFGPAGTSVFAIVDGVIDSQGNNLDLRVGTNGAYGYRLYLKGDDGNLYYYVHINKSIYSAGTRVTAGTKIATIGTFPATTGSTHLHISRQAGAVYTILTQANGCCPKSC